MNRLVCYFLVLLCAQKGTAQLADGTIAPDFTAQDINGEFWNLYTTLGQGKTVVLDISATWCTPCWTYHESHALQQIMDEHGPEGDNKMQVLFIEGDPTTNANCLYGANGCNNFTKGNWVAGVNFPIFENSGIASMYANNFYPTVYVICPNKKIYQVGQAPADDLWEFARQCPVANGVNNAGIFEFNKGTNASEICGQITVAPTFKLINLGTNTLSSAQFEVKWNSVSIASKTWSGVLAKYAEANIALDPIVLNTAGILSVELQKANGMNDNFPEANIQTAAYKASPKVKGNKALIQINTDQYGKELYWELRDVDGNILDNGGNKAIGANGGGLYKNNNVPNSPFAYGSLTTIRDTLILPNDGCYALHFVDGYGDGFCCEWGQGGYQLIDLSNGSTLLSGGDFAAYDDRIFEVETLSSSKEIAVVNNLTVFPNPASSSVQIGFYLNEKTDIQWALVNTIGQNVKLSSINSLQMGKHFLPIEVTDVPDGLYLLHLTTEKGSAAVQVLIEH